jgi:hypothetical protein
LTRYVEAEAATNAKNATTLRTMTLGWVMEPAAAGAAKTRRFFVH